MSLFPIRIISDDLTHFKQERKKRGKRFSILVMEISDGIIDYYQKFDEACIP